MQIVCKSLFTKGVQNAHKRLIKIASSSLKTKIKFTVKIY